MSVYNYVIPFTLNIVITMGIGMFWYSFKGFGRIWVRSTFGSEGQFEYTFRNKSPTLPMLTTLVCNMLQNLFLLFVVSNIYMPSDYTSVTKMAITVVFLHVIYELPHVGFEARSYLGFIIHFGFHLITTTVSLTNYYLFLKE